jgi:hypothetical protein
MNNPFALELKGNCLFIDNSTLSTLSTCPRKAAYAFLAKRQEVRNRMALFFGGAIHKALEIRDREQQVLCTSAVEEKMIDGLVEYYQDCDDQNNDYRNLAYAIRTIERYNKTWAADTNTAITLPSGEIAVELPFAIPIGELELNTSIWVSDPDIASGTPQYRHISTIQVIFTGKIDRVCTHQGAIYLLDHKTTSIGGPTFFDEFYTSHQFRGYSWAVTQLLGTPVAGVLINGLICRPPLKSGDTNYSFDRHSINIDQPQIDDWQESFLTIIQSFLSLHTTQPHHLPPDRAYPMHTTSCITKYGKCEFFSVCQLTPSHRPALLFSGLYETNTWSPLEDKAKPKPQPPTAFPGLFQ